MSLSLAQLARRPLELHHHKPLAIKMAIPKFEESYNPNKHYDPDRERTENAKLQKELKREKKVRVSAFQKLKHAFCFAATNSANFRVLFANFGKMRRLLLQKVFGRRERRMLPTTRNTSVLLQRFKERKEWRQRLTSEKRNGARRARNSLCNITYARISESSERLPNLPHAMSESPKWLAKTFVALMY